MYKLRFLFVFAYSFICMIEAIKPNLFVFYSPNQGSNAYLLVGKKTILIDTSDSNNSSTLKEELKEIGFAPKDIDLVLFTHGHCDHFSGAKQFQKATLRMHRLDADYVNNHDEMYTASNIFESKYFPEISAFLDDNEVIEAKPFKLKVIKTPGHTQGSVCFYDAEQKLLFSGDLIFKSGVGRFDLLSGNKQDLVKSIKSVEKLDFDLLLPGHGLVVKEQQKENIEFALKTISGSFI